MYTYYQVSPVVVVNCRSNMYINCTTLKFPVHMANIVWTTHVQREILYTYNKVVTVVAIKLLGEATHCTTPRLIPHLSTHHMEHNGMQYSCTHTTITALGCCKLS